MKSFIRQKQNPSQLVDIRGSQNASPYNVLNPRMCYFTRQGGIKVAHQLSFPVAQMLKFLISWPWDEFILEYLGELTIVAVVQSLKLHPTLCDPMNYSTPGFPVLPISPSLLR